MIHKFHFVIGEQCDVQVKFLHKSRLFKEKITNTTEKTRLSGLISVREDTQSVKGSDQVVIVLFHKAFVYV